MNTPIQQKRVASGRSLTKLLPASLACTALLAATAEPRVQAQSPTNPPAATLLPPRPASVTPVQADPLPVVRASGEDIDTLPPYSPEPSSAEPTKPASTDSTMPSITETKGGSRTYPPTYSSSQRAGLLDLGSLRRISRTKPATEVAPVSSTVVPPVPPLSGRLVSGTTQPNASLPAWHWYGYGATVPGQNVYAPAGSYPQASANWLVQSGATPGAFPQPAATPARTPAGEAPPTYSLPVFRNDLHPAPGAAPYAPVSRNGSTDDAPPAPKTEKQTTPASGAKEVLPLPALPRSSDLDWQKPTTSSDEPDTLPDSSMAPGTIPLPPLDGQAHPGLIIPNVPSGAPRATFEGGVRPTPEPPKEDPLSLNRTQEKSPLARGQAPTEPTTKRNPPAPAKALVDRISKAAGKSAMRLEVTQTAQWVLKVRFIVSKQSEGEAAVNRIAALPELAKYRVDFEVGIR